MPSRPASVVLVEDSAPYAALVALLLTDAMPGGAVVRRHERLASALADLAETEADCVLLDLSLPDADGMDGLTALRAAGVRAPVVVLSGHDDDEIALAAFAAGAQDYLVKGQERPPARFVRAIRFAMARRHAQERREDLLRAREDRWRTLTHLAPVGITETDAAGRCIFANDWLSELTGLPPEELVGHGWRAALHPDDRAELEVSSRVAAAGDGTFAVELRFVRPRGEAVWAQLTAVLLRDLSGRPGGWLGTLVDVTDAHRARERLRDLARTDPLTRLANRREWDERLEVELSRATRHGTSLCIAALDLDHFKAFNDRHGHPAGDALLRETTASWSGVLRSVDLLARWGGDEFALLLPDCDVGGAEAIVLRLQGLTRDAVGCTAGVACARPGDETPAALMARVDAALYRAKADGRGGIATVG